MKQKPPAHKRNKSDTLRLGLHNSLARNRPLWEQSPRTLISLLDMIEFQGYEFTSLLSQLEEEGQNAYKQVQQQGPACLAANEDKFRVAEMLAKISKHCTRLGFTNSYNKITHALSRIVHPMIPEIAFAVVESELSGLHHTLMCDLQNKRFAFIEESKARYFEREDLFGGEFRDSASTEINAEIKAAGNCLAADLNTAAIFHLMRVVEYAMRAVVVYLKIKVKNKPIEHAGWDELIRLIEKEVRTRREKYDQSKTKKKGDLEACKFYRLVADEMNIFKEIWRNNVMHTQGAYGVTEALAVFERVQNFMQRLAKRVPLL